MQTGVQGPCVRPRLPRDLRKAHADGGGDGAFITWAVSLRWEPDLWSQKNLVFVNFSSVTCRPGRQKEPG